MVVLRPLRLVIENYPQNGSETFEAPNHPADPALGTRRVPFSRELFIERDDFMEDPPRKFFRFAPGREVRLRYACLVTCTGVDRDPRTGAVVGDTRPLRSRFTRREGAGRPQVKGTVHWVCARKGVTATVRLYDRLFREATPSRDVERLGEEINQASLEVLHSSVIEPSLTLADPGERFPFERLGYFVADSGVHTYAAPVFNRTVTLREHLGQAAEQAALNSAGGSQAPARLPAESVMRRSRPAFA